MQSIDLDRPGVLSCALSLDGNGNPHITYRALSPVRFRAPLIYVTATETTQTAPTFPDNTIMTVTLIIFVSILTDIIGAFICKEKTLFRKDIPLNIHT